MLGFILLNLVALRRTQREQAALAQARDAIAQRAAMEAQLHQAQKVEAVALLTAGIAHDFNNLLTIVSANIALLEQQLDNLSPRQQKFIASANSACERAAALTDRLLGFARREPIDPQPIDANEIISGLTDLPWRIARRPDRVDAPACAGFVAGVRRSLRARERARQPGDKCPRRDGGRGTADGRDAELPVRRRLPADAPAGDRRRRLCL